jgi:hypothetical protein
MTSQHVVRAQVTDSAAPDSRPWNSPHPLTRMKKSNSILRVTHNQEEMLVGLNDFAIDKVGYDDPFFADDELDVAAG